MGGGGGRGMYVGGVAGFVTAYEESRWTHLDPDPFSNP